MKFIEPKIGDVFIFRGFKLKCIQAFASTHCRSCFFQKNDVSCIGVKCAWERRKDKHDVVFELISAENKPLFIPLKTEWFEKFASGEKSIEYRRYGARWNELTCCPGRTVVLSKGYGKSARLRGFVKSSRVVKNPPDYVREIYPVGDIFAIEIEVER